MAELDFGNLNSNELREKYEELALDYEALRREHESLTREYERQMREFRDVSDEHEELIREYYDLSERFEWVRLNEELYRVAMGLTDHTITVVDIEAHTLHQIYNEGDWTGITNSMENAPESIIEAGIIHPDDCDGYREFYNKIYSGVPKGEYTMRVLEENRGWVWFTMYYQTTFDDKGKPIRAICFSDDITVKVKANEKYEHYKQAVVQDADFVWELNLSRDKVMQDNDSFGELFGHDESMTFTELAATAFRSITDDAEREAVMKAFDRETLIDSYLNAKREVSATYHFDGKDGRGIRTHHATIYLMSNALGEVLGILCSNDITQDTGTE